MEITPKTWLNVVIGYPLQHSQSPMLHAAIYQLLGINAVLLAMPGLQLKSLIETIKTRAIALTAVTLPYKEKVIKYIDQCSPEVNAVGAANTLIQRDGKLYGYNTDIDGITFAFNKISVRDRRALLIGAGGAARAMGYFLQKNQANIFWLNRTKKKAHFLANEFGGNVICHEDLNTLDLDIIINATPIGLYPDVNSSPLPNYTFNENQVVFDMVYNPVETELLIQAKKYRAEIISGLDMFIGQGIKQVELLTGKRIHSSSILKNLKKIIIQNQMEG